MTDLILSIIALVTCALVASGCFYKHFQKRESLKPAPLIPWILPCLAAFATGFMVLVHLVNLMGLETGRN